jgi:hypothetical protein
MKPFFKGFFYLININKIFLNEYILLIKETKGVVLVSFYVYLIANKY